MKNIVPEFTIGRAVAKVLSSLPPKSREVLARRFGIGYESPETLESIGKSHGITRERVRQIQEYGLGKLEVYRIEEALGPFFRNAQNHMQEKGGVVKESDFFAALGKPKDRAAISFALKLMRGLVRRDETDDLHARYALDEKHLEMTEGWALGVHTALSQGNGPIPISQLLMLVRTEGEKAGNAPKISPEYFISLSKRIKQGPFGGYGLVEWPAIRPRGVRDKAHLVFEKEARPLHFREISNLIDAHFVRAEKGLRKTNPQTVHNELIKDPRFVLIGRGLYALANWGYNPGTVKDVLVQILKEKGQPMIREEILTLIAQRRFVKPNTVFLNLQNKNYFQKLTDGKYYLA